MELEEEQAANKVEQLQQTIAKLNESLSESSSRKESKEESEREGISKENSDLKFKVCKYIIPINFEIFVIILF